MGNKHRETRAKVKKALRMNGWYENEFGELKHRMTKEEARRALLVAQWRRIQMETQIIERVTEKAREEIQAACGAEFFAEKVWWGDITNPRNYPLITTTPEPLIERPKFGVWRPRSRALQVPTRFSVDPVTKTLQYKLEPYVDWLIAELERQMTRGRIKVDFSSVRSFWSLDLPPTPRPRDVHTVGSFKHTTHQAFLDQILGEIAEIPITPARDKDTEILFTEEFL